MAHHRNKTTFRHAAVAAELLTDAQLDEAVSQIKNPPNGPTATDLEVTDEMLAAHFVRQGVLTEYQVDQLRSGRTKLTLGPYVVTDWIGQGGMGQVFKAVHRIMGREVALKVLPLDRSNPDSIAKFNREIRTQSQLDHPNLVRAFDAGHDGNVYYLVTEYVPGADLRRLVRSEGKLSVQQAAKVGLDTAMALEHAHQRGLIHRDVKPGNILVTPEGVAKVSDLGLAGFIDEGESDPRSGKIVGTPDYLSPEQIKTPHQVTPASDIYSLGCTLYYAVTGKVPFPGGSPAEKARRHCEETPWHPRRFDPDINEEFVELIADMMAKDPEKRIATATEVIARLEPWAREAAPLPSQQMTPSPWMSPPLPTGADQEQDETSVDGIEHGSSDDSGVSQTSQSTDPINASIHETRQVQGSFPPVLPPPAPPVQQTSVGVALAIALAIAVPISMVVGALLMLGIMLYFQS